MSSALHDLFSMSTSNDIQAFCMQADDKAKVVAINHAPTSVRLTLKLGSLTGRAAFSHVPFLHSILWMTESILMAPKTVDMPQTPVGAMEVCSLSTHGCFVRMLQSGMLPVCMPVIIFRTLEVIWTPLPPTHGLCFAWLCCAEAPYSLLAWRDTRLCTVCSRHTCNWDPPWGCCQAPVHVQVQEQGFRPSRLRVDAAIRTVSLVLCNDKLTTYGAPDVLQVSVDQLDGHFYRNACFADRPANQARPCCEMPIPCTEKRKLLSETAHREGAPMPCTICMNSMLS